MKISQKTLDRITEKYEKKINEILKSSGTSRISTSFRDIANNRLNVIGLKNFFYQQSGEFSKEDKQTYAAQLGKLKGYFHLLDKYPEFKKEEIFKDDNAIYNSDSDELSCGYFPKQKRRMRADEYLDYCKQELSKKFGY